MAKNEFDPDFDFEKEYGFDPNEFLDSDLDADIDFSQFDEEQPDAAPEAETEEDSSIWPSASCSSMVYSPCSTPGRPRLMAAEFAQPGSPVPPASTPTSFTCSASTKG